jgi:hypothetical protein
MLPGFGQDTIDSFNVFEEEKTIAGRNICYIFWGKVGNESKS